MIPPTQVGGELRVKFHPLGGTHVGKVAFAAAVGHTEASSKGSVHRIEPYQVTNAVRTDDDGKDDDNVAGSQGREQPHDVKVRTSFRSRREYSKLSSRQKLQLVLYYLHTEYSIVMVQLNRTVWCIDSGQEVHAHQSDGTY